MLNEAAVTAARWWRRSNLDAFLVELACQVLLRAAQGMSDEDLQRYLDYRKRGLPAGSEEEQMVEDVKRALVTEGTRLFDDVTHIREAEARAEKERLRRAEEAAKRERERSRFAFDVWWDEQRYKRSMIPENAYRGGRNGRRRKKEKGGRIDTTPLDVVIRKHNERLFRENRASRT